VHLLKWHIERHSLRIQGSAGGTRSSSSRRPNTKLRMWRCADQREIGPVQQHEYPRSHAGEYMKQFQEVGECEQPSLGTVHLRMSWHTRCWECKEHSPRLDWPGRLWAMGQEGYSRMGIDRRLSRSQHHAKTAWRQSLCESQYKRSK
jgi:hypothetical protein